MVYQYGTTMLVVTEAPTLDFSAVTDRQPVRLREGLLDPCSKQCLVTRPSGNANHELRLGAKPIMELGKSDWCKKEGALQAQTNRLQESSSQTALLFHRSVLK